MPELHDRSESPIMGMARLARILVSGDDPAPLWDRLSARLQADLTDGDTLFDMAMLLRLMGKVDQSMVFQNQALSLRPCYSCRHGDGAGLRVLVFVTGGDVMSNAPIDFLCEGSQMTLHFLHMDVAAAIDLPEHDVAFIAVGYSEINRPVLEVLSELATAWPRPIMNGRPDRVLALTRDGTSALFADGAPVLAPTNLLVERGQVERLAAGAVGLAELQPDFTYPMLIRPLDTHGGKGLERIATPSDWWTYLDAHPDASFVLAPFIDYSGAGGLFRKLRITFIDGEAFPTHMAVSEHWLVHYISAGMLESADKRAEEAAWMTGFDRDFAVRHAAALRTIAERIGVDYFSIDCAELPDGRLLLFEADVASIVHALDPEQVFPYKRPAMARLFAAFRQALERRAPGEQTSDLAPVSIRSAA